MLLPQKVSAPHSPLLSKWKTRNSNVASSGSDQRRDAKARKAPTLPVASNFSVRAVVAVVVNREMK